jgi:inner membrane protein
MLAPMPSPLGHTLLGASAAQWLPGETIQRPVAWIVFVVICANAADLDFVPGILVGEPNRYHHQASHSLVAAVLFGVLVGVIARLKGLSGKTLGLSASLIYASHLLGDYLARDDAPPYGIPLFWPVSGEYFISPVALFTDIHHGEPEGGVMSMLLDLFSSHNLWAMMTELLIVGPVLAVALMIRRRRARLTAM